MTKTAVLVYFHQDVMFDVLSNLWSVFVNNVRLKERNTRRKITVRRKKRSIDPVNQSIKHSLIQKMTLPKGEKEGLVIKTLTRSVTRLNQIPKMTLPKGEKEGQVMKTLTRSVARLDQIPKMTLQKEKKVGSAMKTLTRSVARLNQIPKMTLLKGEKEGPLMNTLTRSVTRLDQIQRMNQVKEKGREGRITMKTENTKKDLPVTTGVKAKSKTIEKMLITEGRINMKTKNTEKDHPVITRVKAKEKTIKKMLMTEMIISQSQEDMLQKVSPILMSLKGGMGAFENQALLDLLLIHSDVNHTISGEMWLLSFQKKRGLLNLGRCNLLLSYMKGRDGNV